MSLFFSSISWSRHFKSSRCFSIWPRNRCIFWKSDAFNQFAVASVLLSSLLAEFASLCFGLSACFEIRRFSSCNRLTSAANSLVSLCHCSSTASNSWRCVEKKEECILIFWIRAHCLTWLKNSTESRKQAINCILLIYLATFKLFNARRWLNAWRRKLLDSFIRNARELWNDSPFIFVWKEKIDSIGAPNDETKAMENTQKLVNNMLYWISIQRVKRKSCISIFKILILMSSKLECGRSKVIY